VNLAQFRLHEQLDFGPLIARFEAPWREAFAVEAEAAASMRTDVLQPLLSRYLACVFVQCRSSTFPDSDLTWPRAPLLRKLLVRTGCVLEANMSRRAMIVVLARCETKVKAWDVAEWADDFRQSQRDRDPYIVPVQDPLGELKPLVRALRDVDAERLADWRSIETNFRSFPAFFDPSGVAAFSSSLRTLERLDYDTNDLESLLLTRKEADERMRQTAMRLNREARTKADVEYEKGLAAKQAKADFDKSVAGRVTSFLNKLAGRAPDAPKEAGPAPIKAGPKATALASQISTKLVLARKELERQAEDRREADRANVRVENEARLLFVDLMLETGLVFVFAQGNVPAWLKTEAARALGVVEARVFPELAARTLDQRFLDSWRLQGTDGMLDGFRTHVLSQYRKA
jgi:hypothetical protein